MGALNKFHAGVTFVNKKIFQGAMWLIYPLIAVIMYEVVMRYILNSPTNWVYDMTWIIFGAFTFLGYAYTLAEGGHVKADIVLDLLPPRGKAFFVVICYIIFFFPMMIGLCTSSYTYMVKSIVLNEYSINTSWAPIIWPCKIIMFISMVMLLAQGLAEFLLEVANLFGKKSAAAPNTIETNGGEAE